MESGFQLWTALWVLCKQPGITYTRCKGKTSHITQTGPYSCSCALLHQLAQLHGTVHNSRLDDSSQILWAWQHQLSTNTLNTVCNLVGLTYTLFYCHLGVLFNIQKFFDISDSTAGLLQTGTVMQFLDTLTHTHADTCTHNLCNVCCKWISALLVIAWQKIVSECLNKLEIFPSVPFLSLTTLAGVSISWVIFFIYCKSVS